MADPKKKPDKKHVYRARSRRPQPKAAAEPLETPVQQAAAEVPQPGYQQDDVPTQANEGTPSSAGNSSVGYDDTGYDEAGHDDAVYNEAAYGDTSLDAQYALEEPGLEPEPDAGEDADYAYDDDEANYTFDDEEPDFLDSLDTAREELNFRQAARKRSLRVVLTIMMCLCVVVLGVAIWQLIGINKGYQEGREEYDALVPDFSYTPTPPISNAVAYDPGDESASSGSSSTVERPLTLDDVLAMNPDCVGWIQIPDTAVNYPVVRGADNDKYLNHTFLGNYNSVGAIFMDTANSRDFTSLHTVIYGHNMKDGSMFGTLAKYLDSSYLQNNPYIIIRTPQLTLKYRIFSVRVTDMYDSGYRKDFADSSDFSNFVSSYGGPASASSIITLSTCTNNADEERLLVVAALE